MAESNASSSTSTSRADAALAAIGIVLLLVAFFIVRPAGTPGPAMRDFEAYYAAGATANRGGNPYGREIWQAEREVPGVDVSHDETLPFVGPPAGLWLWRSLALLPFEIAGRLWGAALAAGMLAVVFGSLSLAGAPRRTQVMLGAAIFAGSYGPLTSDVALGQVALLSGAGIVLALVLLRTAAWLAAAPAAMLAALQPNLALVLIPRTVDARAWIAFALGFAGFVALQLIFGGGVAGTAAYLQLLRVHGAAERLAAIQISPGALAFGFGASETVASVVQLVAAAVAVGLAIAAARNVREIEARVAIAICALPFAVPFFHEHDFLIALLPAVICAVRARGATLAFAAVVAVASGVDWLGLGQRPNGETQSVVLASAAALGFVLVTGRRPWAWAALVVPCAVAAVSFLARAHPVPIWPDALPAHWQPPPGISVSAVWELEQRLCGLAQPNAVWSLLRACSLAAMGLLGFALYATVREPRAAVIQAAGS